MKRGTTVLFVLDHKLRDGILVRQTPTEAIIRTTEKVYKVRKTQVATEDIGGRNARARFSAVTDTRYPPSYTPSGRTIRYYSCSRRRPELSV